MNRLDSTDFAHIIEQMHDAMCILDERGIIIHGNPRMEAISGYPLDSMIGKDLSILLSESTNEQDWNDLQSAIRGGRVWKGRLINRRKPSLPMRLVGANPKDNPSEYWAFLTVSPIRDANGMLRLFAVNIRDITEKVEMEQRFEFERSEARVRADISMILQTNDPLEDRLKKSLELLMGLRELEVQNKCGIFICNEEGTHLDMVVYHGDFTDEFLEREQRIPFGACLCGRVAQSGEILVSDDCFCDPRHEHTFEGMSSHGHYIVPLRAFGKTIGVLFLYTDPFPSHEEHRLVTIQSVGDAMAVAIANSQVQEKLIEASRAAFEASRAKSEFLANMSHEIRTPLNGILGFTDMLRRDADKIDEAERKEWLEVIHASGKHLLQLINNILDLSKVEADALDIERTECKPIEILSDLVSIMRVQAREKAIGLDVRCVGPMPRVIESDPTRLRQVLTNLIGNALKFTEQGGVTIKSRFVDKGKDGAFLVFDVIDTGTGIPPDKLETIFNPFSQADTSITRKYGGTGLGLAISKRIANALGGTLEVKSELGKGSTFTLTIPVDTSNGIELIEGFSTDGVQRVSKRAKDTCPLVKLDGHILLVDDGQTNRQLIELVLKRAGATVTTAENGHSAKLLVEKNHYDLILMDMQMPIMDGYSATKAIREEGVDTPIIALTASAMKGDREKCLEAGCNDYLTKPVNINELLTAAAHWMHPTHDDASDRASGDPVDTNASDHPGQSEASQLISTLPIDDPEFLEIVLDYVDHLTDKLSEIERACEICDAKSLARLAHWMKGSGGTAGFDVLTEPAARLEELALKDEIEDAARVVEEIKDLTQQIERGISSITQDR